MKKVLMICATAAVLLAGNSAALAAGVDAVQNARIAKLEATVGKLTKLLASSKTGTAQVAGTTQVWASPMAVQLASYQVEGIGVDVLASPAPQPLPDYAEVTPNNFEGIAYFYNDGTYTINYSNSGASLQMNTDVNGLPVYSIAPLGGAFVDNGTYVLNGLTMTLTSLVDGSVTTLHMSPNYLTVTGSKTFSDPTAPAGTTLYSTQLIIATRIN